LNNPVLVLRAKTECPKGVAAETIKPALNLSKG
jgi:UDP-N-acetylglucosamine 2-epimerase